MKKLIPFLLLLVVSTATFSQLTTNSLTKTDYLQKNKKQKKAATIILLAGPVLIFTPALIHPKKAGEATFGIVMATISAGFLCLPVSIGLFITASSNKKKAMRLSFKNETVTELQKNSFINRSIPSLSIKISL